MDNIKEIINRKADKLAKLKNVTAVYEGLKVRDGVKTGERCVVVGVTKKLPKSKLSKGDLIPQEISGVKTDVVEIGEIVPQSTTSRHRPFPCGVSIGNIKITAGTAGCFVRDVATGSIYVLSNAHVLCEHIDADISKQETRICQPGRYDDNNVNNNIVGNLKRFMQIEDTRENKIDAAVMEPLSENLLDLETGILGIGYPTGITSAELNMKVMKSGRTSNITHGTVIGINASVYVNYGYKVKFVDQILFSNISDGGDSGSLILTEDRKAVALLFAGSSNVTVGNRIQNVLRTLDIELITKHEEPIDEFTKVINVELEPEGEWTIKGTVTNKKSGVAVDGAEVGLYQGDLISSTRTDSSGKYEISGIKSGEYSLKFSKEGYRTKEIDVSLE